MQLWRPPCRWQALVAAVLAAVLLCRTVLAADAAEVDVDAVDCGSRLSLDQRLLMEQWRAAGGDCAQPVKTRVTDRFLGFTCVERGTDAPVCRSYVPGADSRTYDTAQFFRCVDLGLTGWEDGITISHIREWASPKDECNWDPGADILAVEVDFDNSQICAATLCMPVERLSVIGKVRLKQLLESAFRDLDLSAEALGPRLIKPVQYYQKRNK